MPTKKHVIFRKHLHRRIQSQFVIFSIIAVVMFGVVIYDVIQLGASFWFVIIGAVLGVLVGYLVGRAFKLKWHEDSKKVIMGVDRLGVLLIAVYIIFRYSSNAIFGHFVHGENLTALIYSTLAGIMVGRVLSMSVRIRKLLRDRGIL